MASWSLLGVLLAVLLATLRHCFAWWRDVGRMARVSASIPGPPTLPLLGNFLQVSRSRLQKSFQGMLQEHGYLIRLWFGPLLAVFVLDAKDAEVALSSPWCSRKPWVVYRLIEPVLGRGLLVLNDIEHRRHRKLILPSLHREVINQFQPIMQNVADEMVDVLRPMADSGEVFDVVPQCGVAAIDSAFRTILNASGELFSEEQRRLVVSEVDKLSALLMHRFLRPWYHWDWLFRWDRQYTEYQRMNGLYDHIILTVLESKMGKKQAPSPSGSAPRRRQAFLDHVLDSDEGKQLSRQELYGELKTMLAASFVTSMDTLSIQLLLLSILPDVQAKIHRELDDVLGAERADRPLEQNDLDHLEYLERFIKEAMRYYPPLPAFARRCARDVTLPSGHTLPAGCFVALSPLATHHNPEYYPDPGRFDPDRFLPAAVASRPPCAYMPFSAGPRNCIGGRYAMTFLKTHLACVLRRYTVLPDPSGPQSVHRIKMKMGITYYPRDGARIRLRERPPHPARRPGGT